MDASRASKAFLFLTRCLHKSKLTVDFYLCKARNLTLLFWLDSLELLLYGEGEVYIALCLLACKKVNSSLLSAIAVAETNNQSCLVGNWH